MRETFAPPAESPLRCTARYGEVRNDQVKACTFGVTGTWIVAVPRVVSCGTVSMATQLMGCFGAWLVIGMLQRTACGAAHYILSPDVPPAVRWGPMVEIATPLGIALLIVVTGAATVLTDFELPREWYEAQAASLMGYVAFFLAVVFFNPSLFFPADAFVPANPFQTPAHIKPEWYFLANYQTLKIFPSEFLGLAVQGAAMTLLALLPFIDRGRERHPLKRPLFLCGAAGGIIAYLGLMIWGHYS